MLPRVAESVMGAVQGWAASIRFNPTLAAQFEAYPPSAPSSRLQPPLRLDQDTLTIGLCCLVSVPGSGRRLHMGAAKLGRMCAGRAACTARAVAGCAAEGCVAAGIQGAAGHVLAWCVQRLPVDGAARLGQPEGKSVCRQCDAPQRARQPSRKPCATAPHVRLPAARQAHTRLAWRLCAARPRPFVSETDRRCLCAVARSGASCTT